MTSCGLRFKMNTLDYLVYGDHSSPEASPSALSRGEGTDPAI
jgi:hypothetical protein